LKQILYIGSYNEGSTSQMRGECIRLLSSDIVFSVINTDIALSQTSRIFRSIGWRYKLGLLIANINNLILSSIGKNKYDLVWIDKGVFIKPSTILQLKKLSGKIVHFTPDPAFHYHRSKLFFSSLPLYDYVITTKKFEESEYAHYGVKTIFCTQGYDPAIHKPYHSFSEKHGVVFIGHMEDEREEILSKLIEAEVHVTLAGIKWNKLIKRYKFKNNFNYKGKELLGEAYAKEISAAQIGLGLLSKWIPETHTTRTFEIPACRTALLTEMNDETKSLFSTDEAIFYDSKSEIVDLVKAYLFDKVLLSKITQKGYERVKAVRADYKNIISNLLNEIGIMHDV